MTETKLNVKYAAGLGSFIYFIILYNMITPGLTLFTVTLGMLLQALFITWIIELIIIGVILVIFGLIALLIN